MKIYSRIFIIFHLFSFIWTWNINELWVNFLQITSSPNIISLSFWFLKLYIVSLSHCIKQGQKYKQQNMWASDIY